MLSCALSVLGSFGVGLFGSVDQAAFVRTEVAAGVAPPVPNTDPEKTLTVEVTPGYGVRERDARTAFVLRLLPRFYYRQPDLGDVDRPLALARANAGLTHRISELVTWTSAVSGSYGELDYSSTRLAFTAPVARNLSDPVVDVREVDGRTAFEWRVTETYSLDFGALAAYTRLIGDEALDLPTSASVGAELVQRWQLDALSSFAIPITPRYYWVDNDRDTLSASLQGVYERQLSLRDTFRATAGATFEKQEGLELEVLPRASLALSSVVYQRPGLRLTNVVSAGIDVLFDPALGELRPIALASWSEQAEIGTRWVVTATAQGFTSADTEPLSGSPEALALASQGETELGASIVAAHRLSEALSVDFGVRASTRASHWAADDFAFIDEQAWVFTGLTLLFGFGARETPDWMR